MMKLVRWFLPFALLGLAATAHAEDSEYSAEVKPVTLKVGQSVPLEVLFAPKGSWHWNKEYPAKLELTVGNATVARALLKQADGDFKVVDASVAAAFAVTATGAGTSVGTITGKIGLCDDKACVIKKIELPVSVVATP